MWMPHAGSALLRELVEQHPGQRVLVFVASRYRAEHVANKLYAKGIYATAFHGELSQGARETVLREFKANRWQVLVTTDLAARGIHIEALPVVINRPAPLPRRLHPPRGPHAGRAGLSGTAISFVTPEAHGALAAWFCQAQPAGLATGDPARYPVTDKRQSAHRTKTATTAASKASA